MSKPQTKPTSVRTEQAPMSQAELRRWATEALALSKWATPRVAVAILKALDRCDAMDELAAEDAA